MIENDLILTNLFLFILNDKLTIYYFELDV
jgi:hypothetical protein